MGDEDLELLHLVSIEKLTARNLHALLERFGSARNVITAPERETVVHVGPEIARAIASFSESDARRVWQRALEPSAARVIPYYSAEYPSWLTLIDSFPPVIFIRGSIRHEDETAVAVIGTRGATVYGKEIARNFTAAFVRAGITVVSGMARGVDTAAHRAALENGGRTIAVLGTGIDICYPPENARLMADIGRTGAVISEFSPGTPPFAHNFPRRNRIVSGLARAVVAIEARERSGVMNTVKWALDQNKDVFAVPGNIYSKTSCGTNRLIKDGAIPVTSPEEVLDYLGMTHVQSERTARAALTDENERRIWEALSHEPVCLDALAEKLNEPTGAILSILLSLEIKGYVKQLPGMAFVRIFE